MHTNLFTYKCNLIYEKQKQHSDTAQWTAICCPLIHGNAQCREDFQANQNLRENCRAHSVSGNKEARDHSNPYNKYDIVQYIFGLA